MSGVGSSPALATCETSQVLLAGVSGGFPGVLPFRPPIDWLVSMSEIILKGTLNRIKKKKKKKKIQIFRMKGKFEVLSPHDHSCLYDIKT